VYLPSVHEEKDIAVLQALIRAHPLGTWATQGEGELIVNHVPFLIDSSRGKYGALVGHVARANTVWQRFSKTMPSVVIFQGADCYITPSWYPSKRAHGNVVPTWNYVVAHAHGLPRAIDDKAWLVAHLNQLTDIHEAAQTLPWKVSDAPAEFIDSMIGRVVGIEIPISRLIGKWKLSQNRTMPDRLGVVAGLSARGDPESKAMAELVRQATPAE
jgi:transcriptional regulator